MWHRCLRGRGASSPPVSSAELPASYRVDVPGGVLTVTIDDEHHAHLKGPGESMVVAERAGRGGFEIRVSAIAGLRRTVGGDD